jgi:hypothetical protein
MLRSTQIEAPRLNVNGSSGHATNGHGNENGVNVNGRGLAHRPFADRLALGVDVATGAKRLDPSLGQIAAACRITHTQLRRAIRAQAVIKARLRTIVDTIGIDDAFDLLSEVEVELIGEDAGLGAD